MGSIFGIGIDIIENKRIEKLIAQWGNKLLYKIFSSNEIQNAPSCNTGCYYAKRFAAKEAFVKALGVGFSSNIVKTEIAILNNKYGKPFIMVTGKTKMYADSLTSENVNYFISLSDEKQFSVAQVLIETI